MKGQKHFLLSEKIRLKNYKNWNSYTFRQKQSWIERRLYHLRKAAYAGQPEAQFSLACFYEYGVYIDGHFYLNKKTKMIYWMRRAADALWPDAAEHMAMLYETHPRIQNLKQAKIYYELYDELIGAKMSKNRKLFLKQLKKGAFIKDDNGYYKLAEDWKERLKE